MGVGAAKGVEEGVQERVKVGAEEEEAEDWVKMGVGDGVQKRAEDEMEKSAGEGLEEGAEGSEGVAGTGKEKIMAVDLMAMAPIEGTSSPH
jgi:hypothetical protein